MNELLDMEMALGVSTYRIVTSYGMPIILAKQSRRRELRLWSREEAETIKDRIQDQLQKDLFIEKIRV